MAAYPRPETDAARGGAVANCLTKDTLDRAAHRRKVYASSSEYTRVSRSAITASSPTGVWVLTPSAVSKLDLSKFTPPSIRQARSLRLAPPFMSHGSMGTISVNSGGGSVISLILRPIVKPYRNKNTLPLLAGYFGSLTTRMLDTLRSEERRV